MPVLETKGALSAQGYGLTTSRPQGNFIEDVFSTWLYTGNGGTQTITNGIDLAGKGGLVWVKGRSGSFGTGSHLLQDSARGFGNSTGLSSNSTEAQYSSTGIIQSVSGSGFTTGASGLSNASSTEYVSWTFREQPRFFDVVTYTGNGANRTIAHNLGSVPGCIMVKRTDAIADWVVWHRYASPNVFLNLNNANSQFLSSNIFNTTDPTSTNFTLGTNTAVNASGGTYVAYLFAHDAGGFGATGADNVISCGFYSGNGSSNGPTINLGWEPQWILLKVTGFDSFTTGNWHLMDNMRGMPVGSVDALLAANLSSAESTADYISPTATGFQIRSSSAEVNKLNEGYIYIAIRRGPMRTPTAGTSVFGLNARTGTGVNATVTGGQTDDAVLIKNRGSAVASLFSSRLTGTGYLVTSSADPEVAAGTTILQANPWDVMDGVKVGTTSTITNASGNTFINYLFRRAPGFFDVVCYTGNGVARTVSHNLGVVPELMIVKVRSPPPFTYDWAIYANALGATKYLVFNSTSAAGTNSGMWNNTDPTESVFTVGIGNSTNNNTSPIVAYLFASCPGVSKVGSYTGTGATQVINCGFAAGARFVLIKRTDNTGDWYVWDSARGIVAGNDSYLLLNSTAAEVTNTDWVDTAASGFELSNAGGNNVNINGASYIFLSVS